MQPIVKYDYLIVGSGLFGAVFARQMARRGRKVLIIEKRPHIGGNCYTETIEGIIVHRYGPHVFHTDNEQVWRYVNQFARFNNYINRPKVRYKDRLYSFPINLMTLYQLWGVKTPDEARTKLSEVIIPNQNPGNFQDWILSKVGQDIYRVFIEGYTAKQWQKAPSKLPADIIKRIPIRLTFNDNYYDDLYQGIPCGGYIEMFESMLGDIELRLNTDYFTDRNSWDTVAEKIVYTGRIDEFFDYQLGRLEYRGLRFESKLLDGDYQGNAVINYTEQNVPYTRIIEHKHFDYANQLKTVVTWEYPQPCGPEDVPYYPVNDAGNNRLYQRYRQLALERRDVIFGGRLATYLYLDMDDVIAAALETARHQP